MTISTAPTPLSYAGNGSTTSFPISWKYNAKSHVIATLRSSSGTETVWVLTTNYTLTDPGDTGTLTAVVAPVTGTTLLITLEPPNTQTSDIPLGGAFPSVTVEDGLDLSAQRDAKIESLFLRALRVPKTDTKTGSSLEIPIDTARASKFLAFDADGDPIAAAGTSANLGPVSAFIDTLLDDTTGAAARTTLGAVGLTGNETIAGIKAFTGANTHAAIETHTAQVRWAKGADVASAAALTFGTDGNYFDITGTVTVTSIGTLGVGTVIKLHFDAVLTLIQHVTNLIIKGGDDIVTAAGDEAEFVEYATGSWRMTNYIRALAPEFSIASAATIYLGTASSENVLVTGTVTITGFGTVVAGVTKWCRFSGALILTYNATSLILPNSANYTTAANDCFKFLSLGSGNWICTGYKLQSGKSISGLVSGTVIATTSGTSHTFSGLPAGIKEIKFILMSVSTNGTNYMFLQIGDSGGLETTGYVGNAGATTDTTSFPVTNGTVAAEAYSGIITLTLVDAATNEWVSSGMLNSSTAVLHTSGGHKSPGLTTALDRITISTATAVNTFDGGKVQILYQ